MANNSKQYINSSNQGLLDADFATRTVDIPEHDGSTKGLKLAGTLVTKTAAQINSSLADLVDDTTPQLGGDLDLNGNQITSPDTTDYINIPNGSITLNTNSLARLTVNDSGVMINSLTLNDTSNNELLKFAATASAVNEVTITNNVTGSPPIIDATGGDTNIALNLRAKGTGTVNIMGTATSSAELRLNEDTDNGNNYIGLKAAASIGSNVTFTLPSADGTNTQFLKTDGSGALNFASQTGVVTTRWAVGGAASDKYIVMPHTCTVNKIYTTMDAVLTTTDNTLTFKNHAGTTMTNGTITYTVAGAADGDIDSCTPTANNTFTAGEALRMSDAGEAANTTTANLVVLYTITG